MQEITYDYFFNNENAGLFATTPMNPEILSDLRFCVDGGEVVEFFFNGTVAGVDSANEIYKIDLIDGFGGVVAAGVYTKDL